jgi:hypothetical protein
MNQLTEVGQQQPIGPAGASVSCLVACHDDVQQLPVVAGYSGGMAETATSVPCMRYLLLGCLKCTRCYLTGQLAAILSNIEYFAFPVEFCLVICHYGTRPSSFSLNSVVCPFANCCSSSC